MKNINILCISPLCLFVAIAALLIFHKPRRKTTEEHITQPVCLCYPYKPFMSTENLLRDKEQQKSRWDHKADGNQSTFCILVFFTYSGKLPIQILHWRNQKDSYWLHPDLAFLPNQWRSLHLSHRFQIQTGLQWKRTTARTQEGQEWGFKQSQSSSCPQGWLSQLSEVPSAEEPVSRLFKHTAQWNLT